MYGQIHGHDAGKDRAARHGRQGGTQTGVSASIRKHQAVYHMAVYGAAYLASRAITHSKVVAFEELGMEAIHEFEVKDMPVTVAVDVNGNSVHQTGPEEWREIIVKRKIA